MTAYRPFDDRYVYWHPETKLLDEKRSDLFAEFRPGNLFLTSRQKAERHWEGTPFYVTRHLPDMHLIRSASMCFPSALLAPPAPTNLLALATAAEAGAGFNLSKAASQYLDALGQEFAYAADFISPIWVHSLAIGYSPAYLAENTDGLRLDWPRIPLPNSKDLLLASAELGRKLADLLDPETDVDGVTSWNLRPEFKVIGVATRVDGGNLNDGAGDLAVTAGWGHGGQGGVTMPGKGKAITRPYASEELAAIEQGASAPGLSLEQALAQLGETTVDVYLNDVAYWRCVPSGVWSYTIGGYQVMKKWLSYREKALLGRDLKVEEVREVMRMARRIAAILLLQPALDANYEAVKASTWSWNPK